MTNRGHWLSHYGRSVLWGKDARIAYCVGAATGLACMTSPAVRGAVADPRILGAIGAIGLAVISVSLGSVSLMAGLLDETYSLVIARAGGRSNDVGIDDALEPYRAMAVIGAITLASALTAIVVTIALPNWVVVASASSVVILFGTWSVAGTTQLVFLTAFFAGRKGRLLADRAAANVVKMQKPGEVPNERGRGANAG